MFIFWSQHKCIRFGSTARYVRCEQCSAEFGYVMHREATGHAISWFFLDESGAACRAQDRAEKRLRTTLELGVDPHSCPNCHHLQRNMIREAKRRFLRWMSFRNMILALILTPAGLFLSLLIINAFSGPQFLIPFPVFYGIWAGIALVIILMPFLRLVLAAFYNPQGLTLEQRIARGIYIGIPLEDWDAVQERKEAELRRLGATTFSSRHPRPQPHA